MSVGLCNQDFFSNKFLTSVCPLWLAFPRLSLSPGSADAFGNGLVLKRIAIPNVYSGFRRIKKIKKSSQETSAIF